MKKQIFAILLCIGIVGQTYSSSKTEAQEVSFPVGPYLEKTYSSSEKIALSELDREFLKLMNENNDGPSFYKNVLPFAQKNINLLNPELNIPFILPLIGYVLDSGDNLTEILKRHNINNNLLFRALKFFVENKGLQSTEEGQQIRSNFISIITDKLLHQFFSEPTYPLGIRNLPALKIFLNKLKLKEGFNYVFANPILASSEEEGDVGISAPLASGEIREFAQKVLPKFTLAQVVDSSGNNLAHLAALACSEQAFGFLASIAPKLIYLPNNNKQTAIDLAARCPGIMKKLASFSEKKKVE